MSAVWQGIVEGAVGASWLEQVATVLGVVFVWLAMRESLWNFPVGLVQAAIFGWVCFEGRLYSETVLQGFFLVAMIYGWWHWKRGGSDEKPLAVQRLTTSATVGWIGTTLVLWAAWGWCMARFTNAALPWWDGFVFASSVVAQWLQSRKALENWAGWVIANTIAIGVFWVKEYYWFSVLYFLFWLMSWGGWRAWLKSWRSQRV